jgi:outer membrane protein OmpA-like peptidoglycan-associated protein
LISLKLIYGSQLKVDYFNFDSTKISAKNNENLNGVYDYQNKFINSIKIEY